AFALNILIYVAVAAVNWTMLESQITAGAEAREMSRRVGMYNAVWASASAAAVASAGWMIGHSPATLFAVAIASHVVGAVSLAWHGRGETCLARPSSESGEGDTSVAPTGNRELEAEILHV